MNPRHIREGQQQLQDLEARRQNGDEESQLEAARIVRARRNLLAAEVKD